MFDSLSLTFSAVDNDNSDSGDESFDDSAFAEGLVASAVGFASAGFSVEGSLCDRVLGIAVCGSFLAKITLGGK